MIPHAVAADLAQRGKSPLETDRRASSTSDGDLLVRRRPSRSVTLAPEPKRRRYPERQRRPDLGPFAGLPDVAVDDARVRYAGQRRHRTFRLRANTYMRRRYSILPIAATKLRLFRAHGHPDIPCHRRPKARRCRATAEDIRAQARPLTTSFRPARSRHSGAPPRSPFFCQKYLGGGAQRRGLAPRHPARHNQSALSPSGPFLGRRATLPQKRQRRRVQGRKHP